MWQKQQQKPKSPRLTDGERTAIYKLWLSMDCPTVGSFAKLIGRSKDNITHIINIEMDKRKIG